MYHILQWTPFPNKFQPMPNWQIQKAEWELGLNSCGYHEHATMTVKGWAYPLDIAEKIVAYWTQHYPFADFQIVRHI